MKLELEVIESPCCNAPSTACLGPRISRTYGQRRCVRCKQTFYPFEEEFESEAEHDAVHRIRMAGAPRAALYK